MRPEPTAALLAALTYAAYKHRDQRRKGAGSPPFINHAIEVADLLARVAGVTDAVTLQAAVLHDTLEDTDATPDELEREFGREVRQVVEEVTDEEGLDRVSRKRLQIERSVSLSHRAKLVRLADKIANVQAIAVNPPVDWSLERRMDYLLWTEEVVHGCRGCCDPLERLYDDALRRGLRVIGAQRDDLQA